MRLRLRQILTPSLTLAPALLAAMGCNIFDADAASTANVLLISIDTLRADRMSLYGYHRATTPVLESWTQETVVFDQFFYSGGGTLPSHMSMLTSLHPRTHWVHPGNSRVLEPERVTLAEQLKDEGFVTAAFVDAGWMEGKFGFHQGFDLYDDLGGRFEAILPKALDWLVEHQEERFFLFLHTYDVHSEHKTQLPYSCPGQGELRYAESLGVDFDGCRNERCATSLLAWANKEIQAGNSTAEGIFNDEETQFISALYDGCINYVDTRLSELFGRLKELDLYDNTMIILTSDHGEEFGEHGMYLHDQGGYEELSRLPLIIKFPGGKHGGKRIPVMSTVVDIMPTVLDAMNIQINDQHQGFSLMPAILHSRPIRRDVHMYSVLRTKRWKYFSEQKELYDLRVDPLELNNVYDRHPDLASQLEARVRDLARIDIAAYESFQSTLEQSPDREDTVELTDEEIERLKALGYLQ